ncbi:hypothetical protein FIU82_16925 (plasmid) [Pseudoalteromonas sp. THAF3]|uniref:DUF4435 domain-containing protein n=1 Tax=Pseudoalteromonas sp. THAF3 TaxID=2587843 RepID=UPI001267C9F5|nr:DUF4435 domain-containing protein [Pseudoalteromonas sp. THAF3]QFU06676.1 hypothetical protein FIU82_16925 [Pseudoalteromonas sp. THAF3]
MEVKYDVPKYIASVRMSSKKRILVEGRDDKAHIKNLLDVTIGKNRIKIDTAESIKGDCGVTAKNNRAKIEKIHASCKSSNEHSNLYFLCDREFQEFDVRDQVIDLMKEHKTEGNLSWTLGHSLENYFIESELISDAYRYLTNSEYKGDATKKFKYLLPSALKVISVISLAAKDIGKCSYPLGVIGWEDFNINSGTLEFNIDSWKENETHQILVNFKAAYRKYQPIVEASDEVIYARICRGHTAMQLLQRVFALCLFIAGYQQDERLAKKSASDFSKLKESAISTALCEAWLKTIEGGSDNYPVNLVSSVA